MMYEPVEPRASGASIFEKEAGGDGRGRINFELKVNTVPFFAAQFCMPLALSHFGHLKEDTGHMPT